MIDRYSRLDMSKLWHPEQRFHFMLKVEQAVAQVQGEMNIIPKSAAQAILKKAKFCYKNILKRELLNKHDVTSFVDEVSHHLGSHGAYFHYALTSSDVLDTALSLQIQEAEKILNANFSLLKKQLKYLVLKHKKDLCAGRTHGMHAEPITFGYKMLGYLSELSRATDHFRKACSYCAVGKLSGAVGAYASLPPQLEQKVCKKLHLKAELVSTQVIPRDRLAYLVFSCSVLAGFIERLSTELRHLQRTEIAEVTESFSKKQTGSSAMPHKKNPISGENLTGLSRILRSYIVPSLENISLWHERDISHSSVERVILPDAFILLDYASHRMQVLLKNLKVHTKKMTDNMELSQGRLYSSQVFNSLVSKSLSRKQAYFLVQQICQNMKPGEHLHKLLQKDKRIIKYLNKKELDNIFSGKINLQILLKQLHAKIKTL